MKSTGVIRKLDELGRITLPIEIRRTLNLEEKDGLEIIVQDDSIILIPEKRCTFCNSKKELLEFKEKWVCNECSGKIGSEHEA